MKSVSARFGISDIALKKTCARAGIPTPDRGYWAKNKCRKEDVVTATMRFVGDSREGTYNAVAFVRAVRFDFHKTNR